MEEFFENIGEFAEGPLLAAAFILIIVLPIYFAFRYEKRRRDKMKNNFRMLGEQLGCTVNIPQSRWEFPLIEGIYRSHPIQIWMFLRGYRRRRVAYTAIGVQCRNSQGFALNVWEQGIFSEIGKMFGMQDIITNDVAFDEAFVVKSNNELLARTLLVPALRHQLIELSKGRSGFSFEVKDDRVYYEEAIVLIKEENMQWFRRVLDVLCYVADGVEMASGVANQSIYPKL
jgi:hypothetical protein